MACVDCHAADGTGGTLRMMMGTYPVPTIRYEQLNELDEFLKTL